MEKIVEWFGGEKKFYIILVTLIVMWLLLLGFFVWKTDELTKSPCALCAQKVQEEVICSVGHTGTIVRRVFYPNLTFFDTKG